MLTWNKISHSVSVKVEAVQPQSFSCDSLQCGCVLVHRSEVVSPTQWAERAEQKARERIQPLLDGAQVGGLSVARGVSESFYISP